MGTDESKQVFFFTNSISFIRQIVAIPLFSGLNEESMAAFGAAGGKKASFVDTDQNRSLSTLLIPFRIVVIRSSSNGLGCFNQEKQPKTPNNYP